jgi:hypothetical protein
LFPHGSDDKFGPTLRAWIAACAAVPSPVSTATIDEKQDHGAPKGAAVVRNFPDKSAYGRPAGGANEVQCEVVS